VSLPDHGVPVWKVALSPLAYSGHMAPNLYDQNTCRTFELRRTVNGGLVGWSVLDLWLPVSHPFPLFYRNTHSRRASGKVCFFSWNTVCSGQPLVVSWALSSLLVGRRGAIIWLTMTLHPPPKCRPFAYDRRMFRNNLEPEQMRPDFFFFTFVQPGAARLTWVSLATLSQSRCSSFYHQPVSRPVCQAFLPWISLSVPTAEHASF